MAKESRSCRPQETGDFRAFAAKAQIERANQFPLRVFCQFNPYPAPGKALLLGWPVFGKAPKHQFIGGDFNMLGPPCIGEIGPEGPPDQRHIEPHEAQNRPGPDEIEDHAKGEIEPGDDQHEDNETLARQGAVRREDGPPGFRLCVVHAMTLSNAYI